MEYDIQTNEFGTKFYYKKGTTRLHREDGPAVIDNRYKAWYINGILHRTDGPAVEYVSGDTSWWVDGKLLSLSKTYLLREWWKNKNGI